MPETINIFNKNNKSSGDTYVPLAERCRPQTLNEVFGHEKYLKKDSPLRQQIKKGQLLSLIFWGPPGVGKTTLARILANEMDFPFFSLSAVTSGKKEMKEIIDRARFERQQGKNGHLLFIDEIHRYNKAQQDGLLHAVEDGTIILIGATTENPSFEIIAPLLSRCQVIKLEILSKSELEKIVWRAVKADSTFSKLNVKISGLNELLVFGSGDARRTLNLLEICFNLVRAKNGKVDITADVIRNAAEHNTLLYDKKGEYHYDTISAFIKSVRGSDPDAAVYYLARMLDSGEDPVFIARRLIILASEDVGNAEPYALSLATAGLQAVQAIGMPEARIVLAQVSTYLASCPKSNAAYLSIDAAGEEVKNKPDLKTPLHLRNAPTKLMKELGYSSGYQYAHNFPGHFVEQFYLPEEISDKIFYKPTDQGREKILKERLENLWKKRKKDSKK